MINNTRIPSSVTYATLTQVSQSIYDVRQAIFSPER
jgi:hypothetical protein